MSKGDAREVTPGRPWPRGADEMRALLAEGAFEEITPDTALARAILDQAAQAIAAAHDHRGTFPSSAFTTAYDAARLSVNALLEHQGLRIKPNKGHLTARDVVAHQLDATLAREFDGIRRMRHATEYPTPSSNAITPSDVDDALAVASKLHGATAQLIEVMGAFR